MSTYNPGDRVYWWFDTGAMGPKQVAVTVVRVNRKTITVLNNWDEHVRIPQAMIEGLVDWDES